MTIVIAGIIALRSEFINARSWEYPTSEEEAQRKRLLRSGIALMGVGAASMIATGILLGVRKRNLRRFQEVADLGHRRVQWELARNRCAPTRQAQNLHRPLAKT